MELLRPVSLPNLPRGRVILLAMGERGAEALRTPLAARGVDCLALPAADGLPAFEADHADLLFHHVNDKIVIISQEISCKANDLYSLGFDVILHNMPLNRKYPGNIPLNLCRIASCGIHRLDATAPVLLELLRTTGVRLLDTRARLYKVFRLRS